MTIELIPAHLKKDLVTTPANALVDLSILNADDLTTLQQTRIIAIPLLVRVLIALKQNHIDRIFIQYLASQQSTVDFLRANPLVNNSLDFFLLTSAQETHVDLLQRTAHTGVYLLNPFYLINGVMLDTFENHFERTHSGHTEIIRNSISKNHLLWLPPLFLQSLAKNPQVSVSESAKSAGKKRLKSLAAKPPDKR